MAKLGIDLSGKGGLTPFYFGNFVGGNTSAAHYKYDGDDTQVAAGIFNPLREDGYFGHANNTFVDVTENDETYNITSLFKNCVYDRANNKLYFLNEKQIWYRNSASTLAYTNAISASGAVIKDAIIYTVNDTAKLFIAYVASGGSNVAIMDLSSYAIDEDWLSTIPSGAFTMSASAAGIVFCDGGNGKLYIIEQNKVHSIDGTSFGGANGTAAQNLIYFNRNSFCSDAMLFKGNLVMAFNRGSSSTFGDSEFTETGDFGVAIWNKDETASGSIIDFIPISGIKGIVKLYTTDFGELRCVTLSAIGAMEIRKFDGATFQVLYTLPYVARATSRNGFDYDSGLLKWIGEDGKLYAFGKVGTVKKDALYILGSLGTTTEQVVGIGVVRHYNSATSQSQLKANLYLMYGISNTYYQKTFDWMSYSVGSDSSGMTTLVKFLPRESTVHQLDVICLPGTTSSAATSGQIVIYLNQSSTAFKTYTVTMAENKRGYVTIPINKPFIRSIQLKIIPSDSTSNDAFRPSYAIIDYTPQDKIIPR